MTEPVAVPAIESLTEKIERYRSIALRRLETGQEDGRSAVGALNADLTIAASFFEQEDPHNINPNILEILNLARAWLRETAEIDGSADERGEEIEAYTESENLDQLRHLIDKFFNDLAEREPSPLATTIGLAPRPMRVARQDL